MPMTPDERVTQLERQLAEARAAAVSIIMGMADAIAQTPEGREDMAKGFDEAAEECEGETAYLARLAAQALRGR